MNYYDLIDDELKHFYITDLKYAFWIGLIIVFILFVLYILSIFSKIAFLIIILAGVDLLFLLLHIIHKKKYENKITCCDGMIFVYDYKNNLKREIKIDEIKYSYFNVAFDYNRPSIIYKRCLVLYVNMDLENVDLYENMEYRSFWNNPNILIIQNPIAIEMIDKILKNNN